MHLETRSALLAPVNMKMRLLFQERERLASFMQDFPLETLTGAQRWSAMTTVATIVHNIYNGLEEAMKVVCENVDGHVPAGLSSHQDILDQVASPRNGIRKALVSQDMYDDLFHLKGFRHVVNHGYTITLDEARVIENLERADRVLPLFVNAVHALDDDLCQDSSLVDGPSVSP